MSIENRMHQIRTQIARDKQAQAERIAKRQREQKEAELRRQLEDLQLGYDRLKEDAAKASIPDDPEALAKWLLK